MDDTIKALVDNLTYDNWFVQIAIISDAFRESCENAKADRCDDLVICKKRPRCVLDFYVFVSKWFGNGRFKRSETIPELTLHWIDSANKAKGKRLWGNEDIRDQFIPYLTIPQSKRLRRPKK